MLYPHDIGIEDTGSGIKRVHSGINPEFGDGPGKHQRTVQMGERRGRRGVGQVVSRHIHGLHGSDGAGLS